MLFKYDCFNLLQLQVTKCVTLICSYIDVYIFFNLRKYTKVFPEDDDNKENKLFNDSDH